MDPFCHIADIDLVQQGLEGNNEAIRRLQNQLNPYLSTILRGRGATEDFIEEMLAQLWADGFVGTKEPLFRCYTGGSALRLWLGAIITNRWISHKRRENIHSKAVHALSAAAESDSAPPEDFDSALKHTVETAVRGSLSNCNSEEMVMIQLVHLHNITRRELATLLKTHESQVSRRLKAIEKKIATTALDTIREIDANLDVTWGDFLELCDCANLLRA